MKQSLLLTFFLSLFISGLSQNNERDTLNHHSPKKATILSMVLPGAGQVYNKKYWKVPIIYGGLGFAGHLLQDHKKNLNSLKEDLIAAQDDDPNTINDSGYNVSTLNQLIDNRKTWRDQAYIALGAIYVLQVVDANVDAHLFHFDVDEDLSMQVLPYVDPLSQHRGLMLSLNF